MPSASIQSAAIIARRWRLRGQVQGVGFRPFVYRLARRRGLVGEVRNDCGGLMVIAQGPVAALEAFGAELLADCPAAARVWDVDTVAAAVDSRRTDFHIDPSDADGLPTAGVTVDLAVCGDCLAELGDPTDRRARYGLINCTHCGPRYSIIKRVPYDRVNTTMADFAMCPQCLREYENPADRRFHAQPTACPACGPQVSFVDVQGRTMAGDPYAVAAQWLAEGRIIAVKGIGGFHLAVRADDQAAVARLRRLKGRDAKPFALMVRDLAAAQGLVTLSEEGRRAITGPAAPIVLAPRHAAARVAAAVAPGNHRLGIMLPYTPLHHLLFDAAAGRFDALVMTSGNPSDEPLVIDNREALERLKGLCDGLLWHDRPIRRSVDDSVLIDADPPLPVRRSRGYAPMPLSLGAAAGASGPGLCVGGELKNTIAGVRDGAAVLSQHLGDLKHVHAYAQFRQACDDMQALFGIEPAWIACDLHPAYLSTGYARHLAAERGLALVGVQHHHAHAAALIAEYELTEPILAVVCDGVGYGDDGTAWGGELLLVTRSRYQRLASLRPMLLPGGDAAAKDTRRCGTALLRQAMGRDFAASQAARRLIPDDRTRSMLATMIERNVRCVASSAVGRLFDGVASLLGVCDDNTFEAQSGLALETLAAGVSSEVCNAAETLHRIEADADQPDLDRIDFGPLVLHLLEGVRRDTPVPQLARIFHDHLARAWVDVVVKAAARTGVAFVGLSGGVFCNQVLSQTLRCGLLSAGLNVLVHQQVPPGDGGLAYGQAAVATARLSSRSTGREADNVPGRSC